MNAGLSESSGWPISWRLYFSQVNSGRVDGWGPAGLRGVKSMRGKKVFESSDTELLQIKKVSTPVLFRAALAAPLPQQQEVLQMAVCYEDEADRAAALVASQFLMLLWKSVAG